MHQAPQQPDAHKAPGLVTEYYDFSFSTRASLGIALWSAVSKRLIACNSVRRRPQAPYPLSHTARISSSPSSSTARRARWRR